MVDRIEKIKSTDYWKVEGTHDPKKDKREESGGGQEQRSSFDEKTDWTRLISKDAVPRETLNIPVQSIEKFIFKGVSTWRDVAALEMDILLKEGGLKKSALVSIPRMEGLKLVHCQPGQELNLGFLTQSESLRVAVLAPPQVSPVSPASSKKQRGGFRDPLRFDPLSSTGVTQVVLYLAGFVVLIFGLYWLVRLLLI